MPSKPWQLPPSPEQLHFLQQVRDRDLPQSALYSLAGVPQFAIESCFDREWVSLFRKYSRVFGGDYKLINFCKLTERGAEAIALAARHNIASSSAYQSHQSQAQAPPRESPQAGPTPQAVPITDGYLHQIQTGLQQYFDQHPSLRYDEEKKGIEALSEDWENQLVSPILKDLKIAQDFALDAAVFAEAALYRQETQTRKFLMVMLPAICAVIAILGNIVVPAIKQVQRAADSLGSLGDQITDTAEATREAAFPDMSRNLKQGEKISGHKITSLFQPCREPDRSDCRNDRAHMGVDVAMPIGTALYAVGLPGKTATVSCHNDPAGYGNFATIEPQGTDTDYDFLYAHLSRCQSGEFRVGQVIALSGNTGRSTGPHLHFEQIPKSEGDVNPAAINPEYRWVFHAIVGDPPNPPTGRNKNGEATGVFLTNPIPGSDWRNNGGYDADTGLDINAPIGTPVYNVAPGKLVYAVEGGNRQKHEDSNPEEPGFQVSHSVLVELDQSFEFEGKVVRFVWYTHLTTVPGQIKGKSGLRLRAGDPIGTVGVAGGSPHLHIGFWEQRGEVGYLRYDQIARIFWGERQ